MFDLGVEMFHAARPLATPLDYWTHSVTIAMTLVATPNPCMAVVAALIKFDSL
jgi:hypothetical protein